MVTIAQQVVVPIITPDRAELIGPLEIKCSEPDCQSVFRSRSNLVLHLQKVHKKDVSLSFRQENTRFYCPEDGCVYNHKRNLDEQHKKNNYFTELKALKQHYIKVHKAKEYECKNCSKAFPDEFALRRHEKCCGFKYYCAVCGSTYRSQPCLGYHVKQKGHIFTWTDYDSLAELHMVEDESENKRRSGSKKKVLHQAIQTDVEKKANNNKKRGVSQTTQTARSSKKRKSVTSCSQSNKTTGVALEVASTQTLPVDLSVILEDPLLIDSASQTLPSFVENDTILCDIETQTERDVFLCNNIENSSDSTDLLLFNHMQTQTNQEFINIEFSDIETQTHWDTDFDYSDYYVSTETQTHFPRTALFFNNNPSSYTQTSQSVEYLNCLISDEEVPSTSTSIHTQT